MSHCFFETCHRAMDFGNVEKGLRASDRFELNAVTAGSSSFVFTPLRGRVHPHWGHKARFCSSQGGGAFF